MTATDLPLWVIYNHPTDFPDQYVARKHVASSTGVQPTDLVLTSTDLDELRTTLRNQGLIQVPRSDTDDPVIVETWL